VWVWGGCVLAFVAFVAFWWLGFTPSPPVKGQSSKIRMQQVHAMGLSCPHPSS
jgi:hypothetical protein